MPSLNTPVPVKLSGPVTMQENCGGCHYFGVHPAPPGAPAGTPPITFCRRYPMQIIPFMAGPPPRGMLVGPGAAQMIIVQNKAEFPSTTPDNWCGEFDPRRGA